MTQTEQRWKSWLGALCWGVLLLATPVQAAEAPQVGLRFGVYSGYERVAFDWPSRVDYTIERQADRLIIHFGKAARFADGVLRRGKKQRALPATAPGQTGDQYTLIVAPTAQIKDFRNRNAIVLDITGPLLDVKVAGAARPDIRAESGTAVAGLSAREVAPLTLAPLPVPAVAGDKVSLPEPTAAEPVTAGRMGFNGLSGSERAALLQNSQPAMAVSTLAPPGVGQPPLPLVQLNPGTPLAAAIYARGGYGYIILERKLPDTKQIIAGQNPQLQLQPLNLAHATGWRFVMPSGADLRAERSGNTWMVALAGEKRLVPITLALVAEPHYALGARLYLPVTNPPEIVHFFDPVIGDALSVVPLLNSGDALTLPRRYADFTALASAQGMVIAHLSDSLTVRKVPNGIEISAEGGLRLSPPEDTGMVQRLHSERSANRAMLFDFTTWRGLPQENFTTTRQRLLQNIVDVPAVERDRARIELARFYFAHGFAAEALALLNYMQEKLPDLFARPEFRALHGAAQILANNPVGGLQDFAAADLKDVADRPLWEALAHAQLRDYAAAAPKFNATIGFIEDFPPALFNRFALMALESMVATDQAAKADQWLENWRISKDQDDFLALPGTQYLKGVVQYALNSPEQAVKFWKIAAASNDRLYRTRAELALVDFDLNKGKLTAAAAAQRLEGLRFAWRGDPLEWEILRRLGLYYFQAKKYRDGFVNLERARKLYPNEAGNAALAQKLSDMFHDLFTTQIGAAMTPLEALSLYQDYRYLVTDIAVARPIMRALTERLVAIDLLEQAAQLLQDLLLGAEGEEKGRLGARLAGINLLDRQAPKALAALDGSGGEAYPADLQQERLLLRARALIEQGQGDAAKALLAAQNDMAGQMLLADLAWRAGQWAEAAAALRTALGAPPAEGALPPDKAQIAVRAATAYALAADQDGLDALNQAFGNAMRPTAQSALFTVLTEGQDTSSLREMATKIGQSNDNDMFQKFLERYRTPTLATTPVTARAAPDSAPVKPAP